MKLIFCPECQDIQRLIPTTTRYCDCGRTWGKYNDDGMGATVGGMAIPLGIDNSSFLCALEMMKIDPNRGWGVGFHAFVIPPNSERISRE